MTCCRYLVEGTGAPRPAGAALMCSAPPSGNSALVGRLLRQAPLLAARLTWRAACSSTVIPSLQSARMLLVAVVEIVC